MSVRGHAGGAVDVRVVEAGDPGLAWALRTELEIFGVENGWSSAEDLAHGQLVVHRPVTRTSQLHVALAPEGSSPVGLIRLVLHDRVQGLDSFPTLRDFRGRQSPVRRGPNLLWPEWEERVARWDPATVVELATQAVRRSVDARPVVDALWLSIDRTFRERGTDHLVMALVKPLFRAYRAKFHGAISQIGSVLEDYIGADSVPAVIDLNHPRFAEVREATNGRRALSGAGIPSPA